MTAESDSAPGGDGLESDEAEGERKIRRLQVLLKEGEFVRRVLWICLAEDSITTGYCNVGSQAHWTNHSNGTAWYTGPDGRKSGRIKRQPLKEVKGFEWFITLVLHSQLESHAIYPRYSDKRPRKRQDSIYYVDPVLFPYGGVACTICVVEPHQTDQFANFPVKGVANIYTYWKPWVAVIFSHACIPGQVDVGLTNSDPLGNGISL